MPANNTPDGDYLEQDLSNDDHYCQHGNFIGSPYGGDYMCHWCEMGEDPDDEPTGEDDWLEAAYEERFEMEL
jgi:hypothetical protein